MKEITLEVKKGEIVFIGKPKRNCRYCHERGFEYIKIAARRKKIPCRCLAIRFLDNIKKESHNETMP